MDLCRGDKLIISLFMFVHVSEDYSQWIGSNSNESIKSIRYYVVTFIIIKPSVLHILYLPMHLQIP